jgi:hypothetical protein
VPPGQGIIAGLLIHDRPIVCPGVTATLAKLKPSQDAIALPRNASLRTSPLSFSLVVSPRRDAGR